VIGAASAVIGKFRSVEKQVRETVVGLRHWLASIPAWVIVLGLSGLVGAVSAMTAVAGLARLRNPQQPELEV